MRIVMSNFGQCNTGAIRRSSKPLKGGFKPERSTLIASNDLAQRMWTRRPI